MKRVDPTTVHGDIQQRYKELALIAMSVRVGAFNEPQMMSVYCVRSQSKSAVGNPIYNSIRTWFLQKIVYYKPLSMPLQIFQATLASDLPHQACF